MPMSTLAPALKKAGMSATDALRQASAVACDVLDGKMHKRGELSAAMTRRLPEVLCPECKPCGAFHVRESLFRLVGVQGVFVIARRPGKGSVYLRTDQWLNVSVSSDPVAARNALLRRYLRCFGPSTAEHFAAWAGIAPADARHSWDSMLDNLVEIDFEGRRSWLHADDLACLESPVQPTGVRFLPPFDAYLDQRDRETLLPDKALHSRVWTKLGNPGVVLVDGRLAGTWRPQKKGKRLVLTVETFSPASREARTEIEAEASLLAPFRGCTVAEVDFAG
ncbi:MAG: hypothetical protein JWO59_1969 [Chloroflexi bacterium]|nr:hypothetical protein [Chloroflexota bacterium]